MERSIYFDGWHKGNYCQHPSLPMRSLHMADDLERLGATMLVWSGLGGGSISLPFLHHEAFGPVDPRQSMWLMPLVKGLKLKKFDKIKNFIEVR